MKKITFVLFILLAAKVVSAQYKPVNEGSAVTFTIKNFGFNVTGSFTGLQGSINFDAQNIANSSFDVTIDAGTVNTDNEMRDGHLKGESYFDVKNNPRIRFVSSKITATNNSGSYTVTGMLTIKGKTKEVSFPFTADPSNGGYIFKGSFKINRKDFGIGGTSTISNELEVQLSVVARKI